MKLGKITKNLQPTLVKAGGAIAGGMAKKIIPFGSDRVKDGVLLLAGLMLSGSKGVMGQLGEGVAIGRAMSLAQGFGIGGGDFIGGIADSNFINGLENLYAGGTVAGVPGDNFNYNNSYTY